MVRRRTAATLPPGVRRRGDRYEVRVYAGREDGRSVYVTRTVGSLALAEKVRGQLLDQLDAADGRRGGPIARDTVAGYFDRWLDGLAATGVARSTVGAWGPSMRKWVLPRIGGKNLDAVRGDDIRNIYRAQHKAGRSTSTSRNTHIALRRLFKDAVDEGKCVTSPMAGVKEPRTNIPPPAPPEIPEVAALIAEADKYRNQAVGVFVRVAFATGARRGETNALQWRDIDFERGTIHLRRATDGDRVGDLGTKPTKTHADARLPVDPGVLEVLRRHRLRADETALACGQRLRATAFVFSPDPLGREQYTPHWSTRAFAKIR